MKMNIEYTNPFSVPEREYNQIVKLVNNEKYNVLLKELRTKLQEIKNKITATFIIESQKQIKLFLINNSIPLSWKLPIYHMVLDQNILDYPLDNSISLKVGSQEITGNTKSILIVRNNKTGMLLGEDPVISLEITSKVSADKIIKFVKNHKKEIEYWQTVIDLPTYKSPVWNNPDLALHIVKLKDNNRLTFMKIADKLSDNENLSDEEIDYLSSAENIKTIYHRFKRFIDK